MMIYQRDEAKTDFIKLSLNFRELRDVEICDPDLLLGAGGHHTTIYRLRMISSRRLKGFCQTSTNTLHLSIKPVFELTKRKDRCHHSYS
jgi:hypothetical protein